MDENNDEDPVRKFLEDHTKRMERIVQTRFNSVMDQLNKLATDNQTMAARLFNIEKVVRSMSAVNGYLSADLTYIKNELDALENYLAEDDAKLKALLDLSTKPIPPTLPTKPSK